MSAKAANSPSILADMPPSGAIVRLAIPATLALLAKAVYNLVDTAYIGMLNSDIALTAVGVTVPLLLTVLVEAVYILLAKPLILLFNSNPVIVDYGRFLLTAQMALYPTFGLCYMMTITYQTIGESRYGLFLSVLRQGLFYVPFILILPRLFGVSGICAAQPAADVLTLLVCVLSVPAMKRIASRNMQAPADE